MNMIFNIEPTCDMEHYVVQVNYTGDTDGWVDITEDFDTYEEAEEWAKKIKFPILSDIPF